MRLDNTDNAWLGYSKNDRKELKDLADSYIDFLSKCKTERECVKEIVSMARKAGYKDLDDIISNGKRLKHGDKVYAVGMGKTVALFNLGNEPFENGMNILGAHIDSPRLDLKQNPLYEDGGMAYLNTHYYGGIKKYQYVTIPLALHGVVAKTDGTMVEVSIGEADDEPVFTITDILIHLASEQMEKKANKAVEGESLDVLVGSIPVKSKEKDPVKSNIVKLLKEKYAIEEEDFMSAEIEVVPAGKARSLGLDESMVLSYGQDDRVCAYTSLVAFLSTPDVERTGVCLLVDKEEIGSVGATGMRSRFFENTLAEVMNAAGAYNDLAMRRTLQNSKMLSSDVSASFDPLYANVFDKQNSAYFGHGVVFNKYTGSRGKSGSNDANAEFMAEIRGILDARNVRYQTCELGKVDAGGGGTIAYIMALYGMDVIDCVVAVLSMHAPYEVTSKSDIYEATKAY
ncbi:MAG: aminopeptidase, partial [Lachnospiraceae bacterium]|nr:aminopeptidase [Lachnospiraceae bacterium]